MKDITPPPIIDHDPNAKMRPKPMSKVRRVVCFVAGVALVIATLQLLIMAGEGRRMFMMLMASGMTAFFAIILLTSALLPNLTLAREKFDRRRHR